MPPPPLPPIFTVAISRLSHSYIVNFPPMCHVLPPSTGPNRQRHLTATAARHPACASPIARWSHHSDHLPPPDCHPLKVPPALGGLRGAFAPGEGEGEG